MSLSLNLPMGMFSPVRPASSTKSSPCRTIEWELLFGCGLDLLIAPSKKKVVDGGGEPAKEDEEHSKGSHAFQNEDCGHQILEDEEGFGHGVEYKLEIAWDLHEMFVAAQVVFSPLGLLSTQPCPQKLLF
jgi:hypothetical protein